MFPYEKYRDSELWKEVEKIIRDLEENQDITRTTAPEYVIGYFCEKMSKNDSE